MLACPWRPGADLAANGVVDTRFVWAALDCPSGFACIPPGTTTVLASMTATLERAVQPGREYVVTAWPMASEGRKHRAGSAIHDAHGCRVALAEALWITVRAYPQPGERSLLRILTDPSRAGRPRPYRPSKKEW